MLLSSPTPVPLPYGVDRHTKLLIPGDGTNGSTSIVDVSDTPHSIAVLGNAQITTAQSVFGGSSLAFDGTTDYLQISDSDDFEFGAGDFTIDLWVRPIANKVSSIIDRRVTNPLAGFSYAIVQNTISGGRFEFYASTNGSTLDIANAISMGSSSVNSWSHLAVSRFGNNIYLYKNGVLQNTIATSATLYSTGAAPLRIGGDVSGANGLQGQMDMIRFSKGFARYRGGAFTPPTRPYSR